jgi:hypothetical protein
VILVDGLGFGFGLVSGLGQGFAFGNCQLATVNPESDHEFI